MKGLYIYYDLNSIDKNAVGIIKKIYLQKDFFTEKFSSKCDLLNLPVKKANNKILRCLSYLFSSKTFDISYLYNKNYDYIYIRRITPNCKSVIKLLQFLKKQNPNCKILYEIPTYPYDNEHNTFILKLILFIDKLYRCKLHLYVDKMVTLSNDEEIFGCKTLKISNGIHSKLIPIICKEVFDKNQINLIAVANFSFWHGYERIIKGLKNYYNNGGTQVFTVHMIGEGADLELYKSLVSEYNLQKYIKFYGALSGDELSKVFNKADIALCSLACHKKNIFLSAELKSREYFCRGLPIITSTKIEGVPDDYKYYLRVSEDDNPINMQEIIDFTFRIYKQNRKNVINEIHEFALCNFSMDNAMNNVVNYIKNGK